MKLSEIKKHLQVVESVSFILPDGKFVPEYFHVTEVGLVTKHFIDCGGTVRHEKVANFQLWDANDYNHRLKPQKLLSIIELSEKKLGIEDLEIEVEYQSDTIGKYGLDFTGNDFKLTTKHTACLALESCSIQQTPKKAKLDLIKSADNTCCTPGGGCC